MKAPLKHIRPPHFFSSFYFFLSLYIFFFLSSAMLFRYFSRSLARSPNSPCPSFSFSPLPYAKDPSKSSGISLSQILPHIYTYIQGGTNSCGTSHEKGGAAHCRHVCLHSYIQYVYIYIHLYIPLYIYIEEFQGQFYRLSSTFKVSILHH